MAGNRDPWDSSWCPVQLAAMPWRRVSTGLVHWTPWFVVRQDDVVRPDGSVGTYQRVESRGSVTVLAIDDKDYLAITRPTRRRNRHQ
jgi:hypothetical protein